MPLGHSCGAQNALHSSQGIARLLLLQDLPGVCWLCGTSHGSNPWMNVFMALVCGCYAELGTGVCMQALCLQACLGALAAVVGMDGFGEYVRSRGGRQGVCLLPSGRLVGAAVPVRWQQQQKQQQQHGTGHIQAPLPSERRWLTGNTPADCVWKTLFAHARRTVMQAARVCLSAAAGWGAHVGHRARHRGWCPEQQYKGRAHPAMRGVCACWGCPVAAGVLA